MNSKFFELPKEKQMNIINAAMDVFAMYDYKRATTDDIVKRAGISKGLLFYYFENKKGLYLYLYQYTEDFIVGELLHESNMSETDFFEIFIDAQLSKVRILRKHPNIYTFFMRAYLEKNGVVQTNMGQSYQGLISRSAASILKRADRSKFKDNVRPEEVMNLVLWLSDGFMRDKTAGGLDEIEQVNDEFIYYLNLLKQAFYKEEYV